MIFAKNNLVNSESNIKICNFTDDSIISKKFLLLFQKLDYIYNWQIDFININLETNKILSNKYNVKSNGLVIILNWKIIYRTIWYIKINILEEKIKSLLIYKKN